MILAGVSINLVVGENGIVTKAGDARDKTEQAKANEEADLLGLEETINKSTVNLPSTTETKPYLPKGFSKVNGTSLSTWLVIQYGSGNHYLCI